MEDSIHLRVFQETLTGPYAKWYVDEKVGSHSTFEYLEISFFSFFQLPVYHDTGLEILSKFKQTASVNIIDNIHGWIQRISTCKDNITPQH
jgi:hypothetical protein